MCNFQFNQLYLLGLVRRRLTKVVEPVKELSGNRGMIVVEADKEYTDG